MGLSFVVVVAAVVVVCLFVCLLRFAIVLIIIQCSGVVGQIASVFRISDTYCSLVTMKPYIPIQSNLKKKSFLPDMLITGICRAL